MSAQVALQITTLAKGGWPKVQIMLLVLNTVCLQDCHEVRLRAGEGWVASVL